MSTYFISLFLFTFYFSLDAFAARKCQKILGKNAALWEYEVYKFKEIGQLKVSYFILTFNFSLYFIKMGIKLRQSSSWLESMYCLERRTKLYVLCVPSAYIFAMLPTWQHAVFNRVHLPFSDLRTVVIYLIDFTA